jgi:hypothetical protein
MLHVPKSSYQINLSFVNARPFTLAFEWLFAAQLALAVLLLFVANGPLGRALELTLAYSIPVTIAGAAAIVLGSVRVRRLPPNDGIRR